MVKAKALNIKNMKETLVNYCGGDIQEYIKIWDNLYQMACLGFITRDTWGKFFDECSSWNIEGDELIDEDTGEVIYNFDNAKIYGEWRPYTA